MKILLVDIPTYQVAIPEHYRQLLLLRLKAEAEMRRHQLGLILNRPSLTYSRGFLTVAKSLLQRGHNVNYVVYSDEEDRQRLSTLVEDADVLGITALTATVNLAADISEFAKRVNPSIISVIGGPHINAAPEETLRAYPTFDFAVFGYGDIVFPKLISDLQNVSDVPGVVFRDPNSGNIARSTSQVIHRDVIDVLPAYELLYRSLDKYAHNVRSQDGCPYECDFCIERRSFVGNVGVRPVNSVIEEISYLSKFCQPGTLIHFSDAVFTLNKKRTLEMCNQLRQFKNRLVFSMDTRVDLIDLEIVKSMVDAGISIFRLGFEESQDNILKSVRKRTSSAMAIETAGLIRSISPASVIHAYWITGLPGSSRESLMANALEIRRLITEKVVDVVGNKIFVPYPGTPYYKSPEKYKMTLLTKDWKYYDRLSFPVYRLDILSEFEIYQGFLLAEAFQVQAYLDRLGTEPTSPPLSLDYVYSSYVAAKIS